MIKRALYLFIKKTVPRELLNIDIDGIYTARG